MRKKMIPIYVALVRNGLRTIDDVPEKLRDAVKTSLDEKGWNWDE